MLAIEMNLPVLVLLPALMVGVGPCAVVVVVVVWSCAVIGGCAVVGAFVEVEFSGIVAVEVEFSGIVLVEVEFSGIAVVEFSVGIAKVGSPPKCNSSLQLSVLQH